MPDPIAFSIGPVDIHWYGLMYLAGFMAFLWLGRKRIALLSHPQITVKLLDDLLFTAKARRAALAAREKVEHVIDFLDLQRYRDTLIAAAKAAQPVRVPRERKPIDFRCEADTGIVRE